MKLYDILLETNVNDFISKATAFVYSTLDEELTKVMTITAKHYDIYRDGDQLSEFVRELRPQFGDVVRASIPAWEGGFAKMAMGEIERRHGKIHKYSNVTTSDDDWKKMWWVGDIVVWIDPTSEKRHADGHFDDNSMRVRDEFPKRLTGGVSERDALTGIKVHFNAKLLTDKLRDSVTEYILDTGELPKSIKTDIRSVQPLIADLLSVYVHEVVHALQYTKHGLEAMARKVASNHTHKLSRFNDKSYATKKTLLNAISNVLSDDSSKWTHAQWERYLSSAIEIDAHATSVATHILSIASRAKSPYEELDILASFVDDLRYADIPYISSFNTYQRKMAPSPEYQRVWRRFLKKVATQIVRRISELRTPTR